MKNEQTKKIRNVNIVNIWFGMRSSWKHFRPSRYLIQSFICQQNGTKNTVKSRCMNFSQSLHQRAMDSTTNSFTLHSFCVRTQICKRHTPRHTFTAFNTTTSASVYFYLIGGKVKVGVYASNTDDRIFYGRSFIKNWKEVVAFRTQPRWVAFTCEWKQFI